MTLIDAKYDADKVTSRKTKWLRFSTYTRRSLYVPPDYSLVR